MNNLRFEALRKIAYQERSAYAPKKVVLIILPKMF